MIDTLKKYRQELTVGLGLLLFLAAFVYLYGIVIPFLVGLGLAFLVFPLVKKMQRLLKNQALSITAFLAILVVGILLVLTVTAQFINRDFKRLNNSFSTLWENHEDDIDEHAQKLKTYLGQLYDFEGLQDDLQDQADSLGQSLASGDESKLDTESIKAGFDKVLSVFSSDDTTDQKSSGSGGFGIMGMFFSTLLYFVLCLYQIDYFQGLRRRYSNGKVNKRFALLVDDFNNSFLRYFKLRSKIVWLLAVLYTITLVALDIPGTVLIVFLIILLSYIPHLQYLTLIPIALGCLVRAIESDHSFLLFFGIILGVFILASILEEALLTPKIMEENIGMNPVIMVLGLSVWSYVLGLPGLLIGVPLTSLLIIYVKRYFLEPAMGDPPE